MEITTLAQLQKAVDQAGVLLQAIHHYCEAHDKTHSEVREARVRFPRGFIRPTGSQRLRLPFIWDKALKSNIAYTMILADTVLWLSLRTDIWGTAREMLTKLYVFLLGTICESITKDYLTGICGKNYRGRTEYLANEAIITRKLQGELDWLWETRNRMHLFQLDSAEYHNDYDDRCHFRSVAAFRGLLVALTRRGVLRTS
jgi:hypothetical protein